MGAHPLCASVCVGYVGLVAHSQNIGIGIGINTSVIQHVHMLYSMCMCKCVHCACK